MLYNFLIEYLALTQTIKKLRKQWVTSRGQRKDVAILLLKVVSNIFVHLMKTVVPEFVAVATLI
uniref:Uncharacterized protein n=1 Tax=Strigamia maritima TaxID=126957 RepID=T1JG77_STRMM